MKIAVTYENGEVFQHFGHTEQFKLYEELAVAASFVLHTGGKAAFVFRPERLWVLLEALSRVRLVPKRMRFVHQSVQAAPSVVMVECRKGGSAEGLVVEPPLIVESDEYFRIYGIEN